jgi:hypothetical protein
VGEWVSSTLRLLWRCGLLGISIYGVS